jgi:hypothetical protein
MPKLNPQLPVDEVKYLPKNVYSTDDLMLDIDTGSKLDIYGNVYVNGYPVTTGAYFDVKAFGAIGDGIVDDTAAINAAFAAVGNAGGGTVVFPAEYTFRITASLIMKDNLSILGYGAVIYQSTVNMASLNTTPGVSNVSIAGLRLTGVLGAGNFGGRAAIEFQAPTSSRIRISDIVIDTVSTSGISLDNVQDVVISNVTMRRCAEHGLYIGTGTDVVVNGLVVREAGYNVALSGFTTGWHIKVRAQRISITNFDLNGGTGTTGGGILLESDGSGTAQWVNISNGVIANMQAQGIRVNAGVLDSMFSQLMIVACAGGYRDLGSSRGVFQGCTVDSPVQPAIWYSAMSTDILCTDNVIVSSSNHGISILGTRCLISNNKLLPGCGNAIAINTGSIDCYVLDNQIHSVATTSAVAGTNIQVRNVGMSTSVTGSSIGFFTATPTTKPTVTGAKGSNVALASLLTQLVALGLITDSSTA